MAFLSPLRYPGGKGLLLKFAEAILRQNVPSDATYVEPFAGGAGVALGLLQADAVARVIIGDADRRIAAFWRAATDHSDSLIERVEHCEVTIETWHEQARIVREGAEDEVDLGFATFFLNRTNHSGIIDARPIGGLNQDGPWPLDCRFNKENLVKRLGLVSDLADRIEVRHGDGANLVTEVTADPDVPLFIYADPPYLTKSDDLYLDTMTYTRHRDLAAALRTSNCCWMASYDVDDRVADELYPHSPILRFDLRHSARRSHVGRELMAFSATCAVGEARSLLRDPTWVREATSLPVEAV
ncbi:DNA adenine methylase [Candidatus Poriferisodalis sp.]|uniref:DNA adenine methylase n=1 Tax=Candidatus Poriferisodalis sp. TaxID=3101277 RepID=UPI003B52BF6B